jgi:hypothetical protein
MPLRLSRCRRGLIHHLLNPVPGGNIAAKNSRGA